MTAATMEKPAIKTGNATLDMVLPLLRADKLEKLAEFAQFLRWLQDNDDDDDWADAPLTEEEEEALRQGRENAKNGNYLTLAEFRESQKCGQ